MKFEEQVLSNAPLVRFENVGVCFRRHYSLLDVLRRRRSGLGSEFWALRGVSFDVHEGETVGILGRNGSGKSTLSMVCAQVYRPDEGSVTVRGRVQLLSIGLGFQPDLTGRENVYVSGTLLGLSKRQVLGRVPEIEAFADIGEFMDEPVRTYSSGMKSRLGFAIATAIKVDILVLDEVLATGDHAFRDKALERMRNLHSLARCALVISHSLGQVRSLCDRVMWIDRGNLVMDGEPDTVVTAYAGFSRDPAAYRAAHPDMFTGEGRSIATSTAAEGPQAR